MSNETHPIIKISSALSRFSHNVGLYGSWFILPLVFVTMWDVIVRKVGGMQMFLIENLGPMFGSTIIQESEWHFHTALFALVLGYGYVNNRHVRVDLVREKLSFRKQVWIEFIGCTIFLVPYCLIVTWFAVEYAVESFSMGEISASTVGLPHRWIIKSVLAFGLLVSSLAGISVWLQTALVLFGPKDLRFPLMTLDWPEDQEAARMRRIKLDDEAAQAARESAGS